MSDKRRGGESALAGAAQRGKMQLRRKEELDEPSSPMRAVRPLIPMLTVRREVGLREQSGQLTLGDCETRYEAHRTEWEMEGDVSSRRNSRAHQAVVKASTSPSALIEAGLKNRSHPLDHIQIILAHIQMIVNLEESPPKSIFSPPPPLLREQSRLTFSSPSHYR